MDASQQISIDFDAVVPDPVPAGSTGKALLTVVEAAHLLGIGRSTAYELIASRQLEVVHIGRAVRVPVVAVHALIGRLRNGEVGRTTRGSCGR